jgi:ATP-dependent Clp protease adaptor protein ClpS
MILMATKSPASPPRVPASPAQQPGRDYDDGDALVLERVPEKIKPPQMYQVVMLNDDYTPMEFVVLVIQEFFNKDLETATQIMLKIHLDGKGVCGVYTKDVAATKVDQVLDAAKKAGHPLQCVMEPAE